MTDYVKSYIGESKSAKNFAKEYPERRSRYRNAAKQRRQYEDDLLTPAAAVNPNAGADSDFVPVTNAVNQVGFFPILKFTEPVLFLYVLRYVTN